MDDSLQVLAAQNTELLSGSAEIMKGLKSILSGLDQFSTSEVDLSGLPEGSIESIPSMLNGPPQSVAQLKAALTALTAGYDNLHNGISGYAGGVAEISKGYGALEEGYSGLVKGGLSLYAGALELNKGTQQLAKGTERLKKGTSSMDRDIENTIDELLGSYTGGDFEVISFMSPRNTNVESVQFVMQTQGIDEKQLETPVQKENVKPLSFWKRLLALFGW